MRVSDNGTLDTFLHRIRIDMLNPDKQKQNKQDILTRKERIALKELLPKPTHSNSRQRLNNCC